MYLTTAEVQGLSLRMYFVCSKACVACSSCQQDPEVADASRTSVLPRIVPPPGLTHFLKSISQGSLQVQFQSGDVARKANPSKYREPDEYASIFESAYDTANAGHIFRFDLVQTRPIQAYIALKVFSK